MIVDDLIPDEIPQDAWIKGKQDGCAHFTTAFRCNNGDKLRNMDNSQLARYLWMESGRMTVEEWEDWLNKEAET